MNIICADILVHFMMHFTFFYVHFTWTFDTPRTEVSLPKWEYSIVSKRRHI